MSANADSALSLALVQCSAPEYKSILSELIFRCFRMQVFEVAGGLMLERGAAKSTERAEL
jgi:hypothetical protein